MSTIFISYCQKDKDLLELVRSRLKVIEFNLPGKVSLGVWDDQQLEAGDDWESVLYAALEGADIAVLLVTYHFLGSAFVRTKELPYLKRRLDEAPKSLVVIPVVCEPCPWKEDAFLSSLQVLDASGELRGADTYHRDMALDGLYKRVKQLVQERLGEDRPPARTAEADKPQRSRESPAALLQGESLRTLELGFRHYNGDDYRVQLRFIDPVQRDNTDEVQYKTRMRPAGLEWGGKPAAEFAGRLFEQVIPEGPATAVLERAARALSAAGPVPLRLRLSIEANASELHRVPWELLARAPRIVSLFEGHSILFARHAAALDESWPAPMIRTFPRRMQLKLLASASPPQRALAAVLESALRQALDASIEGTGADSPRSLQAIAAPVLILLPDITCEYDDCQVGFVDHQGDYIREAVDELGERLRREQCPQQVLILDSAVSEADAAQVLGLRLTELAAELISTGVCAVLTRQAPIDDAAWLEFLNSFLDTFGSSGNLITAEQAARAALDPDDAWRPLVLHRLRTGVAWYRPAVGDRTQDNWRLIEDRIADGDVIPIIGPQVSRYFMRSRSQIARVLASVCRFPLAPYERGNLQKVAQYMEVAEDRRKLERRFMRAARDYAAEGLGIEVPEPGSVPKTRAALDAVWETIARDEDTDEPLRLLASLDCPLYFTTNFHDFLSRALARKLGLPPERIRDRVWTLKDKGDILRIEEDADSHQFEIKSTDPQVHYLFGRYDFPHSLAFTEDDYFRFLLGFKDRWKQLPERVRARFNDSALLFMGFDLEDWDFRVLFRALQELETSQEMRNNPHVAVQITPDDDHLNDPERAQRYLLDYFKLISVKPVVFVGSAGDFLRRIAGKELER